MVFNWVGVRGLWVVCLTSSGFSSRLLFSVGVFWPQVSIVCVCVCVRAWLGAFGVSTGEKKHFNKCERM